MVNIWIWFPVSLWMLKIQWASFLILTQNLKRLFEFLWAFGSSSTNISPTVNLQKNLHNADSVSLLEKQCANCWPYFCPWKHLYEELHLSMQTLAKDWCHTTTLVLQLLPEWLLRCTTAGRASHDDHLDMLWVYSLSVALLAQPLPHLQLLTNHSTDSSGNLTFQSSQDALTVCCSQPWPVTKTQKISLQ